MVTLRSIVPEDRELMLDILTNDTVKLTYMLPDFANRDAALPLFRRLNELSRDESRYVRGICLEDCLIGFLNDVEIQDGSIELGYVIHPDFQGKGYMTNALRDAMDELFSIGYHEIICGAFEENAASIRVMVKAGMHKLDKSDDIEYRGIAHRCVYYHRLKEDQL